MTANPQVRREALYVVTNIFTTSQNHNSNYNLANYDDRKVVAILAQGLRLNDAQIVMEILQALTTIFELDQRCNLKDKESFAYRFEIEGGLDELEQLQKHPNLQVYNAVDEMVSKFFDEDNAD